MLAALLAAMIVGRAHATVDPTLSVAFAGSGAGTVTSQSPDNSIDCSSAAPGAPDCSTTYPQDTPVQLVAAPAAGSYFAGWSGDCGSTTAGMVGFPMPATDATCTAEFDDGGGTQAGPVLTVTTSAEDTTSFGLVAPSCYVNFCSLGDAIANGDGKTIEFANGITAAHTSSGLSVSPASPITIDGGAGVTIDNGTSGSPILTQTGGTLTLSHLTFSGSTTGGGINQSGGTLTLQHVTVQNNANTTPTLFASGGIYATGTLTVTDSTIQGNHAAYCGGIQVGGSGTATFTNTEISDNYAQSAGGGLCVAPEAHVTVNGGRITGNYVTSGPAGGLATSGTLTVTGTAFDGNTSPLAGAALYSAQFASATTTVTNSTFTGNLGSSAVATDTSGASIGLVNDTIAGNNGGVAGKVTLLNTILATSSTVNCSGGPITSLGHNLDDSGVCGFTGTGDLTGDALVADPTVAGFVALLNGSPAIDAGAKGTVGGLTVPATDMAGTARPQGGGVDIGAAEMALHKLTVKTAGTGGGTVAPDAPPAPGGYYVAGSTVHLTATPTGSAAFSAWSGDCVGTNATLGVIVNADKTCTATFLAPPTVKTFAPAKGRVGSTVSIVGTGLTGVSSVQFGGHDAASFRVVSNTKITAVVPNDAVTGAVHVQNVAGSVDTAGSFTVTWIAPKPAGIAPAKAGAGVTVTISGSGFLAASAVTFNGVAADSFTVVTDKKLTAVVPDNAGSTGPVAVTTPGGTGQTKTSFTFVPPPVVSSFSPSTGQLGTPVTITGLHFSGAKYVTFAGGIAKFKVLSDTSIAATVPATAVTGPVTVTTIGGTGISVGTFTVTYTAPTVKSFTPVKGKVGVKVTITGTHFAGTTAVSFGGQSATFTLSSDTKIVATVPAGAASGFIGVTNPAGTGSSATPFLVLP